MRALLLMLAALASPAFAAEPPGQAFALPFGPVPDEINGTPCRPQTGGENFAPSLRCTPAQIDKQPLIAVSVADWKSQPTEAEMAADMREAFHERRIFNIIREETFRPPSDPDAVGYRGVYQTEMGNRYVWAVCSKGKMIRVTAAVFAPTDTAAMSADIERKVFGVVP